ncbi:transcriptional regulator swi6 [Coniosporium tulheliwenetii]|uniref:Transcriptional regulator swi6 n=1 Tax=Coniosporium tulheliwenetii TaxID=3383036 RepID=A0ACC2YHP2_9PEZI|nr:transcriptional regulator swi6 [Cladosporium sp. JES 115]
MDDVGSTPRVRFGYIIRPITRLKEHKDHVSFEDLLNLIDAVCWFRKRLINLYSPRKPVLKSLLSSAVLRSRLDAYAANKSSLLQKSQVRKARSSELERQYRKLGMCASGKEDVYHDPNMGFGTQGPLFPMLHSFVQPPPQLMQGMPFNGQIPGGRHSRDCLFPADWLGSALRRRSRN